MIERKDTHRMIFDDTGSAVGDTVRAIFRDYQYLTTHRSLILFGYYGRLYQQ